VDGLLRGARTLPADLYAQLVSRVKLLAGMDIADRRSPQDGRYSIERAGRSVDARVSSMPTISGEKLCIRLLDRHARAASIEDLGMPPALAMTFRGAVHAPHGFVVVCGPTGSGKTTTLYAALAERNVEAQSLCSVEDPVEICLAGVAQVQINARAGVTFASALRAFLRQDPNAIMLGEIRDAETAMVAASASLSGQLVLATLHASDAPKAIERLAELGVARHTMAAGLTAVIGQRLVRRLCVLCRRRTRAEDAGGAAFGIPPGTTLYVARGCERCSESGYAGRAAIFEAISIDEELRELVAGGASAVRVQDAARQRGYEPMIVHGVRRVVAGETSLDELRRVIAVPASV
jgi:type IV pilus assembly protein PilB